jgi:hypothetical protein
VITDAFLTFILGVVSFLLERLPTADPIGLASFSGIWTGYAFLNGFLPVTEVLSAVGIILGIQAAVYGGQALIQLWRAIPGKFT